MRHMQQQATPPECLANDMWIGYAPPMLYTHGVSVVGMILASPCFTAMTCFSLELKFGNQFETKVHMQRHRIGARGNVTCFPLPWEKIFRALQEQDNRAWGRKGATAATQYRRCCRRRAGYAEIEQ